MHAYISQICKHIYFNIRKTPSLNKKSKYACIYNKHAQNYANYAQMVLLQMILQSVSSFLSYLFALTLPQRLSVGARKWQTKNAIVRPSIET